MLPLLLAVQAASPTPSPALRDWAASLRLDAKTLHDDIAANHPGPLNREDPGFSRRNDDQLALALRRAEKVSDYPGYWFALRAYVASFDDGHVQFGADQGMPPPRAWPGFLTGYDDDGQQVVKVRQDEAAPPLGSRLLSCDGRPADRLARELVGTYQGRWMLAATRYGAGAFVLVDRGNPYAVRPARCRFRIAGEDREAVLTWRETTRDQLAGPLAKVSARARPPIAARTLADGTRWFSLSSFDSDPSSSGGRLLPGLIAGMAKDRAALIGAPAIVLDLRGNNGGSSDWSRQVAAILWGEAAVRKVDDGSAGVDWRASPANVAFMAATFAKLQPTLSPEAKAWFERSIAGMRQALARGEPFWHDPDDDPPPTTPIGPAPTPVEGPIYLLTDAGCGSACLDAVDLWRALGAVHIGQETSADTLYMDVRDDKLPSGLGSIAVPMKVYRGRKRGSNVPVVPDHRYAGDMTDTAALERWVAGLRVPG